MPVKLRRSISDIIKSLRNQDFEEDIFDALEDLDRGYSQPLKGYISYISWELDDQKVDFIYNKVLIEIWRRAQNIKGHDDAEIESRIVWSYFLKIAKSQTLNYLRKEKAVIINIDAEDNNGSSLHEKMSDTTPSAHKTLESETSFDKFYSSLSEGEQKVFDLKANGLQQKEVAEHLGVSEARITQRVNNMRAKRDRIFGN